MQTKTKPKRSWTDIVDTAVFMAKYDSKYVSQICGYTGHPAKDCRYRNPSTSVFGDVPYNRKYTTANMDFLRSSSGNPDTGHKNSQN